MSSARRKAELKALADAEERQKAISCMRHVDDDLYYAGVGIPLLRLALVPSFSTVIVWEIRDIDGTVSAYRSHGSEPGSRLVTGHARLPVPEDALASTVAALQGATCKISVAQPQFGVADADVYIATLYVNFETSVRLTWCDSYEPQDWAPVVHVLRSFQALCESVPEAV